MTMILVVDDEPDIRDLLADVLRGEGYDSVPAGNGHVARDLLANKSFDLVVTDTMMPGLDGLGLVRWMRGQPQLRAIPVVLISAALRPNLNGFGNCVFLPKPFDLEALLEAIAAALGSGSHL
jgi:CheY-like chemotaxis protein